MEEHEQALVVGWWSAVVGEDLIEQEQGGVVRRRARQVAGVEQVQALLQRGRRTGRGLRGADDSDVPDAGGEGGDGGASARLGVVDDDKQHVGACRGLQVSGGEPRQDLHVPTE